MPAPDCRLGIDVGGTNTDAVIMDAADRVIAKAKVPGTAGHHRRDRRRDRRGAARARRWSRERISHVMLGTTHATNAVLERRNLRRVAVIRIGGPGHATASGRCSAGQRDLAAAVSVGAAIVDGGIEFDGQDLSPLDTDAIARFLGQVGGAGRRASRSPACSPRSRRGTSCWPPRWSSASSARCTSRSATRSARSACSSGRTPRSSTAPWPGWPATWPARCGTRSPRTGCGRSRSSRRTTAR